MRPTYWLALLPLLTLVPLTARAQPAPAGSRESLTPPPPPPPEVERRQAPEPPVEQPGEAPGSAVPQTSEPSATAEAAPPAGPSAASAGLRLLAGILGGMAGEAGLGYAGFALGLSVPGSTAGTNVIGAALLGGLGIIVGAGGGTGLAELLVGGSTSAIGGAFLGSLLGSLLAVPLAFVINWVALLAPVAGAVLGCEIAQPHPAQAAAVGARAAPGLQVRPLLSLAPDRTRSVLYGLAGTF